MIVLFVCSFFFLVLYVGFAGSIGKCIYTYIYIVFDVELWEHRLKSTIV